MKDTTLGATPPNERDILKRGGRYSMKKPTGSGNLTWVQGDGQDETSRKILAAGRKTPSAEDFGTEGNASEQTGTSIFDPVLCELIYRWFSPPTGIVLDPFAGGSVRGIVATKLGRQYHGIDLRAEQCTANVIQARGICGENQPTWITGDSTLELANAPEADLLFSCPPYADLEVYSEDPRDLSAIASDDYKAFLAIYRDIIAKGMERLKPNRFACFVVGEVRDPKGIYRNFVGDTVTAFIDAGASYYNEAILITAVGSLPIRAGRQFASGRKLGKTHQNVLVFAKGDVSKAEKACAEKSEEFAGGQLGQCHENILVFVKGDPKAATEACGTVEIAEEVLTAIEQQNTMDELLKPIVTV